MREYILCASMHLKTLEDMVWYVNQHADFPDTEGTSISMLRCTEEDPDVIETFDAFLAKHDLEEQVWVNKLAFGLHFSCDLLWADVSNEFNFNALIAEAGLKKALVFTSYEESPKFNDFVNMVMEFQNDLDTFEETKEEILRYNDVIGHILREHGIEPDMIDVMTLSLGNPDPESHSSEEYSKIAAHIGAPEMPNWAEMLSDIPNIPNSDTDNTYPEELNSNMIFELKTDSENPTQE
jgi:hypothetical protein